LGIAAADIYQDNYIAIMMKNNTALTVHATFVSSLKKRTVKLTVWSIALCGAETWKMTERG